MKMKNRNTSINVIQTTLGGKNLDSIKCMYSRSFASLWMTLICVVFTACSTTKNLPAGETLYAGIDKAPSFCSVRGTGRSGWDFVSLRTYKLAPGKHTLTISPRENLELKALYLLFDDVTLKERR